MWLPDGIAGGLTPAERRRHVRRVATGHSSAGRGPAEAGRAAIRAGRRVHEVARTFGVSVRTAERWAAQVRAAGNRGAA
jgi:transposase-like protein